MTLSSLLSNNPREAIAAVQEWLNEPQLLDVNDYEVVGRGFPPVALTVGGAVRDLLLGMRPKDYDLATRLRPWTVTELFREAGWKVVPKGVQYGVVSVIHPWTRREIEVATFRREYYLRPGDRRSATVVFADSVEEDLARRDFTINAMAVNAAGELVDPFGGRRDLERRLIRFVGVPEERIREDPLRMLRAIRFRSKLGFTIEPRSLEAIRRLSHMILAVSRERWGEEITKAAETPRFREFAEGLVETGLHKFILPEAEEMIHVYHDARGHHYGESVWQHTLDALERADQLHARGMLQPGEVVPFKLAVLLHDIAKPETYSEECTGSTCIHRFHGHEVAGAEKAYEIVVHRWRLPGELGKLVKNIIRYHHVPYSTASAEAAARLLAARYRDIARLLALHAYADSGQEEYLQAAELVKRELAKPKPLLSGRDIMRIYRLEPGPAVGAVKEILYIIQLTFNLKDPRQVVETACHLGILCPGDQEKLRLIKAAPRAAVEAVAKQLARLRNTRLQPA